MDNKRVILDDIMALGLIRDKLVTVVEDLQNEVCDGLLPEEITKTDMYRRAATRIYILDDYLVALDETLDNINNNISQGQQSLDMR